MRNRGNQQKKIQPIRQDITLMTLLANESVAESRSLLKKYGFPDAKNYKDLEIKLAELYFSTQDKVQLEKELASIHPHKNWILKYYPQQKEVEEKQELVVNAPVIKEVVSSADGDCGCKSNFDSSNQTRTEQKTIGTIDYIAMISVVGLIGLSFYVITKSK
jgi:hypothetical protein